MVDKCKVFGVGMPKTGTNSLIRALEILGWVGKHYPTNILRDVDRYDAMADVPVLPWFDVFALEFPDAKFVLTWREEVSWLDSCERHWTTHAKNRTRVTGRMRQRIFGTRIFDKEVFRDIGISHNQRIRNFFKDSPERLLELNICNGEGWDKLCPFLGVQKPDESFPWENRGIIFE